MQIAIEIVNVRLGLLDRVNDMSGYIVLRHFMYSVAILRHNDYF